MTQIVTYLRSTGNMKQNIQELNVGVGDQS